MRVTRTRLDNNQSHDAEGGMRGMVYNLLLLCHWGITTYDGIKSMPDFISGPKVPYGELTWRLLTRVLDGPWNSHYPTESLLPTRNNCAGGGGGNSEILNPVS